MRVDAPGLAVARPRHTSIARTRQGQRVRVTFPIERGISGSRPFAIVRCMAWSWPGTIADDRHEPLRDAAGQRDRPARPRARSSASSGHDQQLRAQLVPGARRIAPMSAGGRPAGATANAGKPGSISAIGPCWKSAAEYGSAST